MALLALVIVRPVSTFAHGEAPAALNGLVGVDEEIIAVRTNIGIALMGPENGYTYLCPAL